MGLFWGSLVIFGGFFLGFVGFGGFLGRFLVFFGMEFFGGFYMRILACLLCLVVVARFWLDFAFLSKSQNRGGLFYLGYKNALFAKTTFWVLRFLTKPKYDKCWLVIAHYGLPRGFFKFFLCQFLSEKKRGGKC